MLIRYHMYNVRIADLGLDIELDPNEEKGVLGQALRSGRAQYVCTDLRNKAQVLKACEGTEVVFHVAAPDSSINNCQLHHSVNVEGTKNVIDACIELRVKRLIYTSSSSVVFDGVHGILNGDESWPYHPSIMTIIRLLKLRGRHLTAARAGRSKFIIGDGNNIYDFTYVENVAHAHICAERALASERTVAEKAAGQPRIHIPVFVMTPIAHVVDWTYRLLGPYGMKVPQLTPSRIRLLSCSRSFNCSKAKDRLGYTPLISLVMGLKRTIESYSHLRAENQCKGSSKASIYPGSGSGTNIN
ncbi:Reticulon-like protein [Quillaja saponaria]|uniref:Reticulon-like protein n=1 Tax=Quillaja saponaria TaxID=32244 RepID=A0AAD7M069_QUISA|nr:Reticulon-like protein [Quillaja saponaria]